MNQAELEAQWARGFDDNKSMLSQASMDEEAMYNLILDARRQQQQKLSIKAKDHTKQILSLFKTNEEAENQQIQQYQNELPQLKRIIQLQETNVIPQTKIIEIRQHVIADLLIDQNTSYQQIPIQEQEIKQVIQKQVNQNTEEEQQLKKKMEKMFQQRQLVHMFRQDERSMEYQIQTHKALFLERFFTPILKTVTSNTISISLPIVSVCYTYTNLTPQMNNEDNTFSKHSPVIALQNLKKLTQVPIRPIKSTLNPITLSQNLNPQQNYESKPTQNIPSLTFPQEVVKYFNNFQTSINKLQSISSKYKPKFLNDHLDEQERGQNFSLSENQNKSLKDFLQTITNCQRTKQLKVTFQNLVDILYIQTLPNLQYVCLKHNKLTSVEHLINNQYIIQLNLSHNKIKQMEGIQYLKHLRNLNMQYNQIETIIDLECEQLEILVLKNNGIRRISGLNKIVNLRSLDVSHNKIEDMRGLGTLLFLNNLDLSFNKIQEVTGIQNCLLLKQLHLQHNIIKQIQNLSYVFLNKLSLSRNQLKKLPEMFLPSLQDLYLDYNKLTHTSLSLFLPRLKILNLDHNKLQDFSPIWCLLQHSNHCEIIKYDNNEGISFLPIIINQLFQAMIYKKMGKLQILNQNPYNIGAKRYYESQYDNLLQYTTQKSNPLFDQLSSKISLIIAENRFIQKVDSNKHEFRKESDFVRNKSIKMVEDLKRICAFIKGSGIFIESKSIFYKYDLYEIKKKKALEKIRTLVVKYKYKKNKRAKYFEKNMGRIKEYILQILKDSKIYSLTKIVLKFSSICGESRKHESANTIKSAWITHRNYKRAMKLISNLRQNKKKIKKVEIEQEDFEQINLDFLDKKYDYATKIKIPEHMNFEHLIYKPQLFQKATELVQNAMIYQQSDTSSRIGSMSNTSSTNNHSIISQHNKPTRNVGKSKTKKILPPIDIQNEVDRIINGMRLENVTSQIRQQIKMSVLQNRKRQKRNSQEQKSWQKFSKRF